MYAFLGLLSLTLAVLLAGGKALLGRPPDAPPWITTSVTTVIVRFTTAVLLVLGLALILQFKIRDIGAPLSQTDTELIGGMLIVLAAVLAVIGRALWWGWESSTFPERKRPIGQRGAIATATERNVPSQSTEAPNGALATDPETPGSERIAPLPPARASAPAEDQRGLGDG